MTQHNATMRFARTATESNRYLYSPTLQPCSNVTRDEDDWDYIDPQMRAVLRIDDAMGAEADALGEFIDGIVCMARIRTIKPEFWEDVGNSKLSPLARLLFIATFNMADDEGRLRWNAPYLKASAFMYDEDIDVAALMVELEAGPISVYDAGGERLAVIVNFGRHQVINKSTPSKFPSPPREIKLTNQDSNLNNLDSTEWGGTRPGSGRPKNQDRHDSSSENQDYGRTTGVLPEDSHTEGNGREIEGKGNRNRDRREIEGNGRDYPIYWDDIDDDGKDSK